MEFDGNYFIKLIDYDAGVTEDDKANPLYIDW